MLFQKLYGLISDYICISIYYSLLHNKLIWYIFQFYCDYRKTIQKLFFCYFKSTLNILYKLHNCFCTKFFDDKYVK